MREYIPPRDGSGPGSAVRLLAFETHEGTVDFVDVEELMGDCVRAWHDYCDTLA
jgi:hypothetical protein